MNCVPRTPSATSSPQAADPYLKKTASLTSMYMGAFMRFANVEALSIHCPSSRFVSTPLRSKCAAPVGSVEFQSDEDRFRRNAPPRPSGLRKTVAKALGRLVPADKSGIPVKLWLLQDHNQDLSLHAARADKEKG